MIRTNITRILMVVASIMTIVGILLMYQVIQDSNDLNVITVHIREGHTETVEFSNLSLVPGSECEYSVKIKSHDNAELPSRVEFKFIKTGGERLEDFAYVKIISGEDVLYDGLLATAFEAQGLIFPVDFEKQINTNLQIVYYLPETTGNEAKNADVLFELHISATNQ